MKRPASLLVLSLSLWGCGSDVAAPPAAGELSKVISQKASPSGTESQATGSGFHPREAVLISFGDTRSAALMLTDTPGACARFQQGKLARWEKAIAFELGKADGYTEDPFEANALPLDAGFYDAVYHDDTTAGPFEDRWTIVFTTERDGQCNNTSTLGSAQHGGVYFQSLDLSVTGGAQGGYFVGFGSTGSQQRFGIFDAEPCVIDIGQIPPEFTCE
ncbi:hypothetical protein ACLESO_17210 [Pyxidicoccus sp. 3LG]